MTYQLYLTQQGSPAAGISRHNDDGSITYVPNCAGNKDWQNYQAWLNAKDNQGNSLNNQPLPA